MVGDCLFDVLSLCPMAKDGPSGGIETFLGFEIVLGTDGGPSVSTQLCSPSKIFSKML